MEIHMKRVILTSIFCAMTTAGAMVQPSTAQTTMPPPSPKAPAETKAPQPGANSFTEAQAKSRLEANGYTAVSELKKDESGIWRGKATHAGHPVDVSLDYQGNIIRN
jgi:putative membrane protein